MFTVMRQLEYSVSIQVQIDMNLGDEVAADTTLQMTWNLFDIKSVFRIRGFKGGHKC